MSKESEQFWIGFDLGGTKIMSSLYDCEFFPVARQREKIRGAEGKTAGLEAIIGLIRKTLDSTTVKPRDLGGIGIGCPGPLDLEQGTIIEAPNLGWKNVPIRDTLEKEFGCPVTVINDVDAGVYGEYRFGAARNSRCVIGAFPGTGIGGGCVYRGEIFQGRRSSCLELGHMQVIPNGQRCGCGRNGCLETVASRLVIASRVAAAAYRGDAPHIYASCGTDIANIRSRALAGAIAAGDTIVKEIVEESAEHLGVAIGNLVNLLSPDTVVLGGGMVEAMPELFLRCTKQAANDRCMPSFVDTFKVLIARLGDDATIMGAAAWAREKTNKAT